MAWMVGLAALSTAGLFAADLVNRHRRRKARGTGTVLRCACGKGATHRVQIHLPLERHCLHLSAFVCLGCMVEVSGLHNQEAPLGFDIAELSGAAEEPAPRRSAR